MRNLMAILTLGAMGAGYIYLQQPPPVGEPYHPIRPATPAWHWALSSFGTTGTKRPSATDLVGRVHERTRSVLNDISRQPELHPAAPADDAFERLRKAVQFAEIPDFSADDSSVEIVADEAKPDRVPVPQFEELQRTAFDSSAKDQPQPKQFDGVEQAGDRLTALDAQRLELTSTPQVTASNPVAESATEKSLTEKTELVEVPDRTQTVVSESVTEPATPAAPIVPKAMPTKDMPKRTLATLISNRVTKYLTAEWKIVGMSTEGRPMHTMHLGESGMRTLVIAGLNGDDRTGVHWLELLSDQLRRRPELLENNEIVFFRAGNPDGLMRNAPNNARGVSLNRNFPSRRYRPTPEFPAFAVPASEVETRIILETLYSFRPRRVIHLGATTGRSQVLYNRAAKSIATEFERSTKLTAQLFDSEQYPGSLEDFADGTLEAGVFSMRLSVENDWKQAWSKLQPHVLSAVVGQSGDAAGQVANQQHDPNRVLIPTVKSETANRNPRRRGYEELPPPPLQ